MGETKLCLSVPTRRLRYFESDISRINLHTWQQKVLYNKNKTQNAKSHMTHSVSWSFKRHSLSTFKHWAQALAANERTVRKVCFLLLLLLMGRSRAKNAANKEPELQRPAGKKQRKPMWIARRAELYQNRCDWTWLTRTRGKGVKVNRVTTGEVLSQDGWFT